MNNAQLINQTSGEVDYYTDPKIISAVHEVMGSIELDPASSATANEKVGAMRFYTPEDEGIFKPWGCRTLWLNWPFGKPEKACEPYCNRQQKNSRHKHHAYDYHGNAAWSRKLASEIQNIGQGCVITYACTSEKWFIHLSLHWQCFLAPRTNYYLPNGEMKKGVTKGSVVTYFGKNQNRFFEVFRSMGIVRPPGIKM